jgi:hypothetical protein
MLTTLPVEIVGGEHADYYRHSSQHVLLRLFLQAKQSACSPPTISTGKAVSMFSSDYFYRGLITGKLDFNATLSFVVFINRTYIKNSIVLISE